MKIDFDRPITLRWIILFIVALWGFQWVFRGYWDPDEARFAYIAQEMAFDGHFFVPYRSGEIYAHKPPLMFWIINMFTLPTGGTMYPFAVRVPSFLGLIMSLWATAFLATRWLGNKSGWRAVAILGTSFLFWSTNTLGQMDPLLLGFQMVSLVCLLCAFNNEHKRKSLFALLAGLALGGGIMMKGPVGFILPIFALIAIKISDKQLRQICSARWILVVAFSVLLPAIWLCGAWLEGAPQEYFNELIFGQTISRAQGQYGHLKGWGYFIWHFPVEFLPWTILLPFSLFVLRKKDKTLYYRLLAWMLIVILFFSCIKSKRNIYILLAYPAAAMIVAATWEDIAAKINRQYKNLSFLSIAMCIVCIMYVIANVFALPLLDRVKTPIELKKYVQKYSPENERLIMLGTNSEIYPLYLGTKGIIFDECRIPEFLDCMFSKQTGTALIRSKHWERVQLEVMTFLSGFEYELVEVSSGRKGARYIRWSEKKVEFK